MIIRDLQPEDLGTIEYLHKKYYSSYGLPSLRHTFMSGVVENSKGFAGFGMVKAYAEAIILLNKDLSHSQQVKALIKLEKTARDLATENHIEEIHCHIPPEASEYAQELTRHFGYKEIPGHSLMLDLK